MMKLLPAHTDRVREHIRVGDRVRILKPQVFNRAGCSVIEGAGSSYRRRAS